MKSLNSMGKRHRSLAVTEILCFGQRSLRNLSSCECQSGALKQVWVAGDSVDRGTEVVEGQVLGVEE